MQVIAAPALALLAATKEVRARQMASEASDLATVTQATLDSNVNGNGHGLLMIQMLPAGSLCYCKADCWLLLCPLNTKEPLLKGRVLLYCVEHSNTAMAPYIRM